MLRGDPYKLIYYPGQDFGELYDIQKDPDEVHNLFEEPDFRSIREQMMRELLDRLILMEGPRHGPSKRGRAYWRYLYTEAFRRVREKMGL
jgi:arylsulfatase A-like enzyme